MKLSLFLSGLILLIGAALGWRDHQHFKAIQHDQAMLMQQAAQLGIEREVLQDSKTTHARLRRNEQAERDAIARQLAKELIALAKEREAPGSPQNLDSAKMERGYELLHEVSCLDASQLKRLVAELRTSDDRDLPMCQGVIQIALRNLASKDPKAALALIAESSDEQNAYLTSSTLNIWAEKDPLGALDWLRKNSAKHPDAASDRTKKSMLSGVAKHNPRLAFQLIGELGFTKPEEASQAITWTTETPEQRSTVLSALREHLKSNEDPAGKDLQKATLESFTNSIADDNFASVTTWLEQAQLSPQETQIVVDQLPYAGTGDNTGKWIEWMTQTATPAANQSAIPTMVQRWTRKDYKAAGTWLNETPESPTRQIAVRSYAQALAPHDPQAAAQWALTLPSDEQRTKLMHSIHREWAKQDAPAAAAFAQEQGIQP